MHYQVEYEVCALLFLLVVTVRFFGMRLFPSRLNRLFGWILYGAIADLVLDIGSAFTIEHAASLPAWVNYAVNTVFYSLQIFFPALLTVYVLLMAGLPLHRRHWLLLIPAAFFELQLLTNPFTHVIFLLPRVDGLLVYTRGPLFNTLYLGSAFYMLLTVGLTLRYRRRMRRVEAWVILLFVFLIIASMVLQFFFPNLLLTGVALTLAILMMFFTLQNPESMLDQISGVFNYHALNVYLLQQLAEKREIWLVAVDVSGMRRVNSTFGVRTGNELMEQIGRFLNRITAKDSWAFRMIGTRFLIVSGSERKYARTIDAVRERFAAPWSCAEAEITVSATIRYCAEAGLFRTAEDVLNLIDMAYAEMGVEGRDTVRAIDADDLRRGQRRMAVEDALRDALSSGQGFSLCFQPLYSVSTGRYESAEALLRLHSPTLGDVSPAEFIPVAEGTGLIFSVDRLVVTESCRFLHRHPELLDAGLSLLHVNLSAAEFTRDTRDLAEHVLSASGGRAELLCFEVTESVAANHLSSLSDFMERMLRAGCRFAMDDFGTGYANLARLAALPFSIVKLDRSLLHSGQERDVVLFEELLHMFHRIGLVTVAEGVETQSQALRVTRLGADLIQGFYYSRPLEEAAFARFLLARAGEGVGS